VERDRRDRLFALAFGVLGDFYLHVCFCFRKLGAAFNLV